jgi:peptidoglycan/LPS O-acetylase OafA/YrhL
MELDGLRAVAIAMVVLRHYFYYSHGETHRPSGFIRGADVHFEQLIALGWTGVDLFFVLSDFLIGGILLDARSLPSYFKTFHLRRFYRIIPLYYGGIVCYLLVMALKGHFFIAHFSSLGGPATDLIAVESPISGVEMARYRFTLLSTETEFQRYVLVQSNP